MHYMWWGLFILSLSLLILLLLRNKAAGTWLLTMGIHMVAASVLLYGVNWIGTYTDFHLPINVGTIAAVGALGIPGLMLLVALKLTIVV